MSSHGGSFLAGRDNRVMMVHWLLEVAEQWGLPPSTLHLSVQYVDWMCARRVHPRGALQCLAITSLAVATKMTLRKAARPMPEYADMTAGAATPAEIRAMERTLLDMHAFALLRPVAVDLVARLLHLHLADIAHAGGGACAACVRAVATGDLVTPCAPRRRLHGLAVVRGQDRGGVHGASSRGGISMLTGGGRLRPGPGSGSFS